MFSDLYDDIVDENEKLKKEVAVLKEKLKAYKAAIAYLKLKVEEIKKYTTIV